MVGLEIQREGWVLEHHFFRSLASRLRAEQWHLPSGDLCEVVEAGVSPPSASSFSGRRGCSKPQPQVSCPSLMLQMQSRGSFSFEAVEFGPLES